MHKQQKETVRSIRRRGFDATTFNPKTGLYRIKCSQCQMLAINGIACHETGCPNNRRTRR
jgi:hypothetical protein